MTRSTLFQGHLLHRRYNGVDNRFRYPIFQFSLDLDELPSLSKNLRLFSYNRHNLHSLFDRDYRDAAHGLQAYIREFTSGADVRAPIARIELMTHVRMFGYVFNPVSFFLCWSADDELVCVVAQVNNTYGQTHPYLLDDTKRKPDIGTTTVWSHTKEMVVSPLIHDAHAYEFRFALTPPTLSQARRAITMHLTRSNGERFFTSTLSGNCTPLTDKNLARAAMRYPFMTAQVIALIHWQAIRLRIAGVPYQAPTTS